MLGGSGPWYRYHQSKLANSVFAQYLHDKLLASTNEDCNNILSVSAHPGTCDTNLFDQHKPTGYIMSKIIQLLVIRHCFLPAENGSMGLLKGMMDCRNNVVGGMCYGPKVYGPNIHSNGGTPVPIPPRPYEIDPKAKDMLWRRSEQAIGVTFDI